MDDPRRGRTGTGAPNEDTTGGFEHGGHLRYFDDTNVNLELVSTELTTS
jgi:hypothetical protein